MALDYYVKREIAQAREYIQTKNKEIGTLQESIKRREDFLHLLLNNKDLFMYAQDDDADDSGSSVF